jgi:hypothetical protein
LHYISSIHQEYSYNLNPGCETCHITTEPQAIIAILFKNGATIMKTAWENRKKTVSEIKQENPFEENIGNEVIDALNVFDRERQGLYDWLSSVAVELPDVSEYNAETTELITATADAFASLAVAIHNASSDIDTEKMEIERLLQQDDNERTKLFSHLAECDCFDALDEERTEAVVSEIYEESEDNKTLYDTVHAVYREYLAGDVGSFAGHLQEKHSVTQSVETKQNETTIEIIMPTPNLRKHALDVAKIALGVTVGLMIHKKLQK